MGPAGACWSKELGEYVLPYDRMRTSDDPEGAALEFMQTAYEAGAVCGGWDRERLEHGN